MRVLKTVFMLALFAISISFTSCTKSDIAEDELYQDAIEKKEIKDQDVG